RGNEGGGAGSCPCQRLKGPPRFPEKLESCDTCGSFTRFTFPNRRVCGLSETPWVTEFKNSYCGKGCPGEGAEWADASRGHRLPAPTSPRAVPSPASPGPDKSQETPWAAETHTDTAWVPWGTAGSGPEPSAEAAAREAGREAPVEEREAAPSPAPDAQTPSIAVVVCVAAAAAAGAVALVYCWRRRQRRRDRAGRGPQVPPGGAGEGAPCLPGENT
ncbi:UNVERIFIED_CONTAM: hypothetical protein K2H54_040265, partial [Gekko kuhli]